jgi:hypothetical protein
MKRYSIYYGNHPHPGFEHLKPGDTLQFNLNEEPLVYDTLTTIRVVENDVAKHTFWYVIDEVGADGSKEEEMK